MSPDDRALEIVHRLVHGGDIKDFKARLPARPDWQADIEFVRQRL